MQKLLFCLAFLISCFCFGQSKKIDSLKNELKNINFDKFPIYNSLIDEYTKISQLDSILKYTKVIVVYASSAKNPENIVKATILNSNILLLQKQYEDAITSAFKSLNIAKGLKKKYSLIAGSYMQLAKIYYLQTDFKNTIIYAEKSASYNKLVKTSSSKDIMRNFYCYIFLVESYNNTGQLIKAKKNIVLLKDLVANNNLKQFEPMVMHLECKILESLGKLKEAINIRIEYLKKVKKIDNTVRKNGNLCEGYYNLAELYTKINLFDTSRKYLDSSKNFLPNYFNKDMMSSFHKNLEAEINKKENTLTLKQINQVINDSIIKSNTKALPFALQQKADLLFSKKKFQDAIFNYESAKMHYLESGDKIGYLEILKNLLQLYIEAGDKENAKKCLLEYEKLKDDLFGIEVATNLSEIEVRYQSKEKEAKIKTQQLLIEKEKNNKYIAFGGIGILLVLTSGVLWFFKNKQKTTALQTQNTLLSLQQNINSMELQNLNQQLNPHEIKNLLASISPEIQEKAPEAYKKMLKLFNITKASLNSNSITDTIENQVQQIDDFLSLEKSMSVVPINYSIENNIQNNQQQIPRLLLKNLVENSIKHGIKGTENGGEILISLNEKDNFIILFVDDTGKGRNHAISLDSGIGTTTYQKLFATLNQKNKENATFKIIDKEQGTKVAIKIPTNYIYS